MEDSTAKGRSDQIILDAINTIRASVFALQCVMLYTKQDDVMRNKTNRLKQISVGIANELAASIGMEDYRTTMFPNMESEVLTRLSDVMAAMGDPETPASVLELLDPSQRKALFERASHVARQTTNDEFLNWYKKAFTNENNQTTVETDPQGPAR